MDDDYFISDNEELYRSIRKQSELTEYYYDDFAKLIFTPEAFRDKYKEPSIDRAKLRSFNPVLSKLSVTDGIVSLIAEDIRSIGDVTTDGTKHSVDVVYAPKYDQPQNLAHAQIQVDPKFFGSENKQKKVFKLLRIALARLATRSGWKLEPK